MSFVLVVLLIEKGIDGMHEYGGFGAALTAEWKQVDMYHILLNVICLPGALLGYNIFSVVREHLARAHCCRCSCHPCPEREGL